MSTPLEVRCAKGTTAVVQDDLLLTGSTLAKLIKQNRVLIVGFLAYIFILLIFNFWKYYTNKYNVLDLAIYNQVFWNLTHGAGLYSGIQQGHYFGDHAEFLIFLLAPIYALLPHPLTLLTLQTIGLASTALPIYLLSRHIYNKTMNAEAAGKCSENLPKVIPLITTILWLGNPILWNINFFEFHILPFAIPLLLWTIYFLLAGRIKLYFLFLFLSLLVREDVALITLMLGAILVFHPLLPPPWKGGGSRWGIGFLTIITSIIWFFAATKLIQHFSTDESYKYLAYYSWLGNSLPEIIKNALLHPQTIIRHILTLPNLEMLLGFLMAFAFLPLLRPKFLLLALFPFLQFILSGSGGSALIWQIHYAALFLPGLIISSIFGLRNLLQKLPYYHFTILSIAIIVILYNFLLLGPVLPAIKQIARDIKNKDWQAENQLFSMIPANASVAATYTPLTKLSSRQNLSALHYLYVGKKQFSRHDYKISESPNFLMIDERGLRTFKVQYESLSWSATTSKNGFKRLENLIAVGNYGIAGRTQNLVLLQKNLGKNNPYKLPKIPPDLQGYITLSGFRSGETIFIEK